MSFRPTAGQALARGAYLGALTGTAVGVVASVLAATGVGRAEEWPFVLAPVLVLAVGAVAGAVCGLLFGRVEGTDVDDRGVHPVPGADYAPWQRIADVRAERHGGRIHLALYLDSGRTARLRVPYDGRGLSGDPAFERKLFMVRHLWATHRNSAPGPRM